MYIRFFAILVIGMFIFGCQRDAPISQQQYSPEEFLAREGTLNGELFKYRIYVPANRRQDEILPVMLYLHGAGNRGDDNESQLNGLAEIIRSNRENFSFIVVIPQCEIDRFWDEKALSNANQALDDSMSELNGDDKQIYLAGFSLGGYGVWSMAAMFPDKFAAVVPMAGRVVPRSSEMKNVSSVVAELSRASDPYEAFAKRLARVPIWIFHGADDRVVPVENSRQMNEALKNVGNTNVRYSEVKDAGHDPLGFQTPELYTWLKEQRRSN